MSHELASQLIPLERVRQLIFLVRGKRVMLDSHLAELYGVDTGALKAPPTKPKGEIGFHAISKEASDGGTTKSKRK
jgi:hypothetical protein